MAEFEAPTEKCDLGSEALAEVFEDRFVAAELGPETARFVHHWFAQCVPLDLAQSLAAVMLVSDLFGSAAEARVRDDLGRTAGEPGFGIERKELAAPVVRTQRFLRMRFVVQQQREAIHQARRNKAAGFGAHDGTDPIERLLRDGRPARGERLFHSCRGKGDAGVIARAAFRSALQGVTRQSAGRFIAAASGLHAGARRKRFREAGVLRCGPVEMRSGLVVILVQPPREQRQTPLCFGAVALGTLCGRGLEQLPLLGEFLAGVGLIGLNEQRLCGDGVGEKNQREHESHDRYRHRVSARGSALCETGTVKLSARRYFARGRVQGVGYRYFAEKAAVDLKLTGYVRNLDDGRVEVYAAGPLARLDDLAGLLRIGPRWADVRSLEEREEAVVKYSGFHIQH